MTSNLDCTALRELHHRFRNDLQTVFSLVSLQLAPFDGDEARAALRTIGLRVRAISAVHERLFESDDPTTFDLGDYVVALVPRIVSTLAPGRPGLETSVSAEPTAIPVEDAVRAALVVNELVSNALTHAFVGRSSGRLDVTLRRLPGGAAELVVADDGVGLPPGIDPATAESIGLGLVAGTMARLGGQLTVERRNGTVFRAVFQALGRQAGSRA